uniref:Uncharacterized protein n=1 Tax=Panagrellus redivivus TaxID=6233 RepID=A0A7E4WCM5_PANRE
MSIDVRCSCWAGVGRIAGGQACAGGGYWKRSLGPRGKKGWTEGQTIVKVRMRGSWDDATVGWTRYGSPGCLKPPGGDGYAQTEREKSSRFHACL